MTKIAGVSTGLALMNLMGNVLVSGENLEETGAEGPIATQAMTARAFRSQHQPLALPFDVTE